MHRATVKSRLRRYLENFRINTSTVEKLADLVNSAEEVVFAGKGRSGNAARLGAFYLRPYKKASFYSDPCAPLADEINSKTLLIAVSGSGKTPEIVNLAGEYKKLGAGVVALTYSEKSPLAELADYVVLLPKRDAEPSDHSYAARSLVRAESPTMGDLPEEMSIFIFYLVAKKLAGFEINAESEINSFMENISERDIDFLKKYLSAYWKAGIYFIGKGRSSVIADMVTNRAFHYGAKVYSYAPNTPPVEHSNLVVLISGTADKSYDELVEIIRKKASVQLPYRTVEPEIIGVFGRAPSWRGIAYVNIGGGRKSKYKELRSKSMPESFYWRAPVLINYVLRLVAEERGITRKLAEREHINF